MSGLYIYDSTLTTIALLLLGFIIGRTRWLRSNIWHTGIDGKRTLTHTSVGLYLLINGRKIPYFEKGTPVGKIEQATTE